MGKRTCSVPGCVKGHVAKGYCKPHYARWVRYGDPLAGGPARDTASASRPRLPIAERLLAHVERTGSGCWLWGGKVDSHGYGEIKVQQRRLRVHRVSYETFTAPIADGLQIDHLCRNRRCINPDHLEPVTSAENTRRGRDALGTWGRGLSKPQDRCLRGHLFDEENTYVSPTTGSRTCRECRRARSREYKKRKRENA